MVAIELPVSPASRRELVAWATEALATTSASPRLDAELLLAHAAGISRAAVLAFPERAVDREGRSRLAELVGRRRAAIPLAYLTGEREFYSLALKVDPRVLVPRPETELVVETALGLLDERARAEVLDLGTGSGAIALAIKCARPSTRVTGVDASRDALAVARGNGAALGVAVGWQPSDWFGTLNGRTFDVIAANPPYVASGDPVLRRDLRHEPAVALDGGPDGLDAIRVIVANAPAHLRPGGWLIVEHGCEQGAAVRALAAAAGWKGARTLRDLAGHDRVLLAGRP